MRKMKTTSYDLLEEFGVDNCKIELLESFPCNNREERNAREGYWIRLNDCVNRVVIGRTKQEYYEQHKEEDKQRREQYYETRREKEDERKHEWYLVGYYYIHLMEMNQQIELNKRLPGYSFQD